MIVQPRRRRSAPPAATTTIDNDDDSDENQVQVLDYREEEYYGWNVEAQVPAPVQVKQPQRDPLTGRFRREADKVHATVWKNDPAKMQKLVRSKGEYVL